MAAYRLAVVCDRLKTRARCRGRARYRILSGDQRSWGVESNPENALSQEQTPGCAPENLASSVARAAELTPENYGAARQARRSHAAPRRVRAI